VIILMGVAGSGKSVQGRQLADELGLPWLSTGEFLRMLISGEPRKAMVNGKLLNDQQIIELVRKIFSLIDLREEFILDGFPRTPAQADWLLNEVKHGQLRISAVIHLIASEEVVCERLLSRGRVDDNEEAIRERFKEYEDTIKPIMADFRQAGVKIVDIDGEQDPTKVHEDIIRALS
jgi:adenylate kinase